MSKPPTCVSCVGSGELPTENGPVDCPDCGGSGFLPSQNVLVDWRSRDLERSIEQGAEVSPQDLRWLLNELRTARTALNEVIALAHDIGEADQPLAFRIRSAASRALGLYQVVDPANVGEQP
jgi:hypothetical protein